MLLVLGKSYLNLKFHKVQNRAATVNDCLDLKFRGLFKEA